MLLGGEGLLRNFQLGDCFMIWKSVGICIMSQVQKGLIYAMWLSLTDLSSILWWRENHGRYFQTGIPIGPHRMISYQKKSPSESLTHISSKLSYSVTAPLTPRIMSSRNYISGEPVYPHINCIGSLYLYWQWSLSGASFHVGNSASNKRNE